MQMDVIFTDCAKAFDKVDHQILLNKLVHFNFSKKAYMFLKSYLTCRPQKVKVGKSLSKLFIASSGVPQGSNLGPLLFVMFINSLPECIVKSNCLLFADDFKIFKIITSKQDCVDLQNDLDSVTSWLTENKMYLNIHKCSSMTFTRRTNPIHNEYTINNMVIVKKNEYKDLGVQLQSNMKFNTHYKNIVNKALRSLGFVIRNTKNFTNMVTIIRLYNALVRPHLEYASVILAPAANVHLEFIERVQKRFLRFLYVRKHNCYPLLISYNSMLESFKIQRLSDRRNLNCIGI